MTATFVLWGCHPLLAGGAPIKLEIGSVRECRAEPRYRRPHGWTGLSILAQGVAYRPELEDKQCPCCCKWGALSRVGDALCPSCANEGCADIGPRHT